MPIWTILAKPEKLCKVRSLEITGGIALATIASYVIYRIIG
ncbi:hypothetical protein FHS20_001520 [Phyllobacterium endophyticum]|nr:hypothetical protein [Phyllobacterium endophyticum]